MKEFSVLMAFGELITGNDRSVEALELESVLLHRMAFWMLRSQTLERCSSSTCDLYNVHEDIRGILMLAYPPTNTFYSLICSSVTVSRTDKNL